MNYLYCTGAQVLEQHGYGDVISLNGERKRGGAPSNVSMGCGNVQRRLDQVHDTRVQHA